MNTQQISAILSSDFMTKNLFHGVFAVDQLSSVCDGMYVINSDEQDKPGEHWLAVYNKEYFDSYGFPPQDKRIIDFLGENVVYNCVGLQHLFSNACGFYCVYYLLQRARGQSMEEIIDTLRKKDGDFIVKNTLYERYKSLFA